MTIKEGKLKGVFIITLDLHEDERGFFMRTYDKDTFKQHRIDKEWIQENHSRSEKKGIIRGLHFQFPPYAETKLIRCIKGAIFDVFVDLRKGSLTFGQWSYGELSEANKKMILIPKGFAHGFCTLTEISEILYKVDSVYTPRAESGIIWNDKTLNINWPVKQPFLSRKDAALPPFKEFVKKYRSIDLKKKYI